MPEEEFRKKFHVRQCKKCCGTCAHSIDCMDDGVYNCVHPHLKSVGEYLLVRESDVCDLWRELK